MSLFRMVELEEGMPVQFVGNYVLRANEPPKYGFIEVDEHELQAQLANAAASEVDAVQGRQECEAELREARAAIIELADYLERVADNDIVDANELHEFVAETKRMYAQEPKETCPMHDFDLPCPSCAIVALEWGAYDDEDAA